MSRHIASYAAALVIFLALDAAYLSTIGGRLFKATLGDVLTPNFSIPPAIAFYVIFPVGLVIFAINPAFESGRWTTALVLGALFGFFTYATYDLTNWATIRNWTPMLTAIDLAWGSLLCAVTALGTFWTIRATLGVE